MVVAEEEVATEGPVAVAAEAVVADGAVQTPLLWVQDADGKSDTSSSKGFASSSKRILQHVSLRAGQISGLPCYPNSGGFFG